MLEFGRDREGFAVRSDRLKNQRHRRACAMARGLPTYHLSIITNLSTYYPPLPTATMPLLPHDYYLPTYRYYNNPVRPSLA